MLKVDERYLTLPEVAARLKVSRRTIYRWIKSGGLDAYQFGREYRITESALKDFLEAHRFRAEGEDDA
jgi:excisionase family DNA binding protein